MTLTPAQLHILQHSLDCDKYGETQYPGDNDNDLCFGLYHRNRYVSDPSIDLSILVLAGYLEDRGPIQVYGDMHYYVVTAAGHQVMLEQSEKKPKLTRSQQRYRDYLRADCGWSFREWLKYGGWKKRETSFQ